MAYVLMLLTETSGFEIKLSKRSFFRNFKDTHLIYTTMRVNSITVFLKTITLVKVSVNNLDDGLVEHLAELAM